MEGVSTGAMILLTDVIEMNKVFLTISKSAICLPVATQTKGKLLQSGVGQVITLENIDCNACHNTIGLLKFLSI